MGRPVGTKNIETPEIMWELFLEYKKEIEEKPILIVEQKKGNIIIPKGYDGKLPEPIVELPARRPLTLEGFENYCADKEIVSDLGLYFSNNEGRYADFLTICKRIRRVIRQDQIEGGMAGIYNPSITQRLNNLTDKTENIQTVIIPDLTPEQRKKFKDDFDSKY